jgi:hypothetical protein
MRLWKQNTYFEGEVHLVLLQACDQFGHLSHRVLAWLVVVLVEFLNSRLLHRIWTIKRTGFRNLATEITAPVTAPVTDPAHPSQHTYHVCIRPPEHTRIAHDPRHRHHSSEHGLSEE